MRLVFVLLLIASMAVGSYATNVRVTTTSLAANSGTLTYVFFETASASGGSSPTVNTALSQPAGTGTTTINRGSTVRLWSTTFTSGRAVSAGVWVVDLWAAASGTSGKLSVSIYITNSAGTVQTTIASSVSTPTIGTTKTQVAIQVSGSSATIPANGYIEVAFTAPTGVGNPTSFTLYWGKAQATNFQVPITVVTA